MNIKVAGQSTNLLRLEVEEGNHEVLHLLVDKLLQDKDVSFAAYDKEHQLFEKYSLVIKTRKKDVKTVLNNAIKELTGEIDLFKKDLVSKIK